MRRGFLRSLSAFLGGTAFAVSVAGPAQWCPCPEHGAQLPPPAAHMQVPAAHMQMPAAEHDASPAGARSGHSAPDSHHTGHQCTCPGGCCGTSPVGLRAPSLGAPLALQVDVLARAAQPGDAIELESSPQLALPFANAPPALRVTPHSAAHSLT